MHSVIFNNKDSYKDYGLVPTSRPVINPPKPRRVVVDIPGVNGVIDRSTALTGAVQYEEREGVFEFLVADRTRNWAEVYSNILNDLHGKTMQIVLSDDKEFYYMGFVEVDEWKSNEANSTITLKISAYPYKKKLAETVVTSQVTTNEKTLNLKNLNERVIPHIEIEGTAKVKYESNIQELQTGTHLLSAPLKQGDNKVTVSGTGTVTFKYREGGL